MDKDIVSVLLTLEPDDIRYYFDGDWRRVAKCLGVTTEMYFPEKGEDQKPLRKICHDCMARQDCLAYALLANEAHGFWGDCSERARKTMRKELSTKRPDLIREGTRLKLKASKALRSKAQELATKASHEKPIELSELQQLLVPKLHGLLRVVHSQAGVVEYDSLMVQVNVSREAFEQRFNLALELGWIKCTDTVVAITGAGQQQLRGTGKPKQVSTPPAARTAASTHKEAAMAKTPPGELSELDTQILTSLNTENAEDEANASGLLAERIGVETGPSFSNRLKRLEDMGYIARDIEGKRTKYIGITGDGRAALQVAGATAAAPAARSNGSRPAPVAGEPSVDEVDIAQQLKDLRRVGDTLEKLVAELTELRAREASRADDEAAAKQQLAELQQKLDELEADLAERDAEIERLKPLAERYEQMQQLMAAPTS